MTPVAPTLQAFFTERLVKQRDVSPRTIASYRDTLRLLLCFVEASTGRAPSQLDWDELDEPVITAFLQHLEHERHNSPRTRNLRLTAIRSLFGYAALRHPEHAAVIQRVLSVPPARFEQRTVTFLTQPECQALLDAPDPDRWEGRRDRAMLTLTIHAGLRVSELTAPAKAMLDTWVAERAGQPADPLFPTRTGRRLSRDAVEQRLDVHVATAAQHCPTLLGKRVHPHVLRHTCAMSLLQAGVDSTVIALWLGHADTRSTQPYIHADMTIKERALALVKPASAAPGRYTPTDDVLRFLDDLG